MSYKYYSPEKIDKENATYNIIFGERSNGKTTSILMKIIKNYVETGKQGAILRRWYDDFKGKNGPAMFDGVVEMEYIRQVTNGLWDSVYYFGLRWYLARTITNEKGERKLEHHDEPFAYGFALTRMEHDKSVSYPNITTIMFDEFITRGYYLPDEFVIFMNVVSTIVRQRDDVKIYMLGNTVNMYCPYFAEMGLKHMNKMQPGDIDLYTYGDSGLRVAVEYADGISKSGKKSDKYFAFDNPKLHMITNGAWEIDIYPHLDQNMKYITREIMVTYFIEFNDEIVQADIVRKPTTAFTYIHKKTTPIKDWDKDIVYTTSTKPQQNVRRNMLRNTDRINRRIYSFFQNDQVYYQNNVVGELVRNYLLWCKNNA